MAFRLIDSGSMTMQIRCVCIGSAALVLAAAPAWSLEGQGLHPNDGGWFAGQWQARVEVGLGLAGARNADAYNIATQSSVNQGAGLSVLGDFYFKSPSATGESSTALSGFRATSGLMVRPRTVSDHSSLGGASGSGAHRFAVAVASGVGADGRGDSGPVPYFGVGYTELPDRGGWGFSADFGLMALSPRSAIKFGGVLGGSQNIDDLLRDLRLSPLIQLGVSYSF